MDQFAGPDTSTYNIMINACRVQGDLDGAQMFDEMRKRGLKPTAHGRSHVGARGGLCEVKDLSLAFELKNEMLERNIELDSAIYTTLISGLFKVGRKDELPELLEEMKKTGCHPETETYNALIAGFCGEKQLDLALEFLLEMELQGRKPVVISYNVLVRAYCEEGKFRDAVTYLRICVVH
ncbi:hypothetical protein Cgig2_002890 [Carnegiea gigantea]|uniref:Pentatricopeptide repeat-containing protein n=1 Tax=Carnegiea gigantea TaxID=171969 RepID=A0A9Q1QL65_9CARY|nr:hypothetical protein Cgig2_002890 [Carnegiea gigantea]